MPAIADGVSIQWSKRGSILWNDPPSPSLLQLAPSMVVQVAMQGELYVSPSATADPATWLRRKQLVPFGNFTTTPSLALADGSVIVAAGAVNNSGVLSAEVWTSGDGGVSWRERSTPPWSPRVGAGVVATSTNRLLVIGGSGVPGGESLSDVWVSTSVGDSWFQDGTSTPSARSHFGLVRMAEGTLVVAGGRSDTGPLNDVWVSTDEGVSWWQQATAAPWSPREMLSMAALPGGTLVLYGGVGVGGVLYSTLWTSADMGASWRSAVASAPWGARAGASILVADDGTLTVVGGFHLAGTYSDVWVMEPHELGLAWGTAPCDTAKPAVCAAPRYAVVVAVSLPGGAGDVSPPPIAPPAPATVVYAPPVPTVSVDSSVQPRHTAASVLQFRVEFSKPVVGLSAHDFVVSRSSLALQRVLAGAGSSYTLTLEVAPITVPGGRGCDDSYEPLVVGGSAWCVREVFGSWLAANAACAPSHLPTILDAQYNLVVAQIVDALAVSNVWYVWVGSGWCYAGLGL